MGDILAPQRTVEYCRDLNLSSILTQNATFFRWLLGIVQTMSALCIEARVFPKLFGVRIK